MVRDAGWRQIAPLLKVNEMESVIPVTQVAERRDRGGLTRGTRHARPPEPRGSGGCGAAGAGHLRGASPQRRRLQAWSHDCDQE